MLDSVQAELEKKTLLLQSISDRINPDAARTPPVATQSAAHTKPAHLATANGSGGGGGHSKSGRKKKRSERGEKGDGGDRSEDAAAKKARKCTPC